MSYNPPPPPPYLSSLHLHGKGAHLKRGFNHNNNSNNSITFIIAEINVVCWKKKKACTELDHTLCSKGFGCASGCWAVSMTSLFTNSWFLRQGQITHCIQNTTNCCRLSIMLTVWLSVCALKKEMFNAVGAGKQTACRGCDRCVGRWRENVRFMWLTSQSDTQECSRGCPKHFPTHLCQHGNSDRGFVFWYLRENKKNAHTEKFNLTNVLLLTDAINQKDLQPKVFPVFHSCETKRHSQPTW